MKPEPQDKELQQITPEAEVGRRYVDKLYKVYLKEGGVGRVIMHMEVQVWPDGDFEERMFGYNSRAYLHYKCPVASLAILGDDDPDWRPTQFSWSVLGCTHLAALSDGEAARLGAALAGVGGAPEPVREGGARASEDSGDAKRPGGAVPVEDTVRAGAVRAGAG